MEPPYIAAGDTSLMPIRILVDLYSIAGRYGNYSGGMVRAAGKGKKQWRKCREAKNNSLI